MFLRTLETFILKPSQKFGKMTLCKQPLEITRSEQNTKLQMLQFLEQYYALPSEWAEALQ